MGMPIWMVVVAPVSAGFGIAAGPDTGVDRKPRRLRFHGGRGDQPFELCQVHGSGVEGIIGHHTDCPTHAGSWAPDSDGYRFEGRDRQDRIEQLEQRIAPTPHEGVYLLTEGSERFSFCCVHIQNDALLSLFLSTAPQPTPCCG
jgi:hypothetical protein